MQGSASRGSILIKEKSYRKGNSINNLVGNSATGIQPFHTSSCNLPGKVLMQYKKQKTLPL
jgi:hypothetical protein